VNVRTQSVSDADSTGSSVLHALLTPDTPPDLSILEDLLDAGAEIDAATVEGITALNKAASRGNLECVRLLLKRGSQAHLKSGTRTTALWEAARSGNIELVELLLDCGASVDGRDDFGMTPLMGACHKGHPQIARLLLARGASVDTIDSLGRTPLHHACDYANCRLSSEERAHALELGKVLVSARARVNARDKNGRLPLDYVDDPHAGAYVDWLRLEMVE
jgi:ankyrin repeat protein